MKLWLAFMYNCIQFFHIAVFAFFSGTNKKKLDLFINNLSYSENLVNLINNVIHVQYFKQYVFIFLLLSLLGCLISRQWLPGCCDYYTKSRRDDIPLSGYWISSWSHHWRIYNIIECSSHGFHTMSISLSYFQRNFWDKKSLLSSYKYIFQKNGEVDCGEMHSSVKFRKKSGNMQLSTDNAS